MLVHNAFLVNRIIDRLQAGRHSRIPFKRYRQAKKYSKQCHYITEDDTDPNIRQAVIQFSKT